MSKITTDTWSHFNVISVENTKLWPLCLLTTFKIFFWETILKKVLRKLPWIYRTFVQETPKSGDFSRWRQWFTCCSLKSSHSFQYFLSKLETKPHFFSRASKCECVFCGVNQQRGCFFASSCWKLWEILWERGEEGTKSI